MELINFWKMAIAGKASVEELRNEVKRNHPSLTSVVFTRECFLKCKHCVYPTADACDISLNDLERIDKAIEATYKAGNRDLIHIGRILKKEHLPILKKYQDMGMSLNLIDNGSGKRLIGDIKEAGVFIDGGIDVSIDGNERSHEAQRGAGAWKLAMDGIEALQEVAGHISITGTASALNFDTIVDGLLDVKKKFPAIKVLQVTTTSPTNFQPQRMALEPEEMKALFAKLLSLKDRQVPKLLIYRHDDLKAIFDQLKAFGQPEMKHVHMEWKIGNLVVAYFPESIVISEEFGIDANGRHITPFGLDHHLADRPEEWEMRGDLFLSDPDASYELLVDKYYAMRGNKRFAEEKELFSRYMNA